MSDSSYNKIDFIIIIVLALLVAFIIGFNIIQMIDNKLGAVTINVPPSKCNLPPIYFNVDKESTIKEVKLNSSIDTFSNVSQMANTENNSNNIEHFGDANPYPYTYTPEPYQPYGATVSNVIAGLTSEKTAEELIAQPSLYNTMQDPDFNNLNHIPVLISPSPPGPNATPDSSPSYYANRVKLIDNPDSDLLKIYNQNHQKLEEKASRCNAMSREAPPIVNGTFDGYNAFNNLNTDSYANVTAIGKGMLTPYTSFPVPS